MRLEVIIAGTVVHDELVMREAIGTTARALAERYYSEKVKVEVWLVARSKMNGNRKETIGQAMERSLYRKAL